MKRNETKESSIGNGEEGFDLEKNEAESTAFIKEIEGYTNYDDIEKLTK
jgi:hypothetical protein